MYLLERFADVRTCVAVRNTHLFPDKEILGGLAANGRCQTLPQLPEGLPRLLSTELLKHQRQTYVLKARET